MNFQVSFNGSMINKDYNWGIKSLRDAFVLAAE